MRVMFVFAVATARSCAPEAAHSPLDPEVEIVVATRDLEAGIPVAASDLALLAMPRSLVVEEAITDPYEVIGQIPTERLLRLEVLRPERFAPARVVGVPEGTVAVEIARGTMAVVPGSRVDLLVTTDDTRTVLEGQQVIAVVDAEGPEPRVVVALLPAEAERVELALATGVPTLVLRSDADFTDR